jgi:2-keto-4-pentenoate hydratase/2-oxohepta-3-ene-1,7-dioic acid hydratase in catechol pathway
VFALGLNYAMHAKEARLELPPMPLTFTKFPSCITGPDAEVAVATDRVDWEVELVAVIGREAYRVDETQAWDHVAGLTVGQDLSARDVQMVGSPPQFSLGKSFPGFGPTGPCLVTPDELADRDDLAIGCAVNGEPVQGDRTSSMLFGVAETIAYLSSICTLLPGDLIFTGTPAGVGNRMDPPRYLAPGDELVSTIEGIGSITTRFTA